MGCKILGINSSKNSNSSSRQLYLLLGCSASILLIMATTRGMSL